MFYTHHSLERDKKNKGDVTDFSPKKHRKHKKGHHTDREPKRKSLCNFHWSY